MNLADGINFRVHPIATDKLKILDQNLGSALERRGRLRIPNHHMFYTVTTSVTLLQTLVVCSREMLFV